VGRYLDTQALERISKNIAEPVLDVIADADVMEEGKTS